MPAEKKAPVLAIIGNGISGITTARVARKLMPELEIHIISSETDYFFSRTALMYIYMGHMRAVDTQPYDKAFFEKNRFQLVRDFVTAVDPNRKQLSYKSGGSLDYDFLVLAVGSVSNKFGWPGQDLAGVQGLYSMQDLELLEENTATKPERGVIVGGGLIGLELAEMLHSRQIPVTLLVREKSYMSHIFPPEESELINAEIRLNHMDLRLETELKSIEDDGNGRACAVITDKGDRLDTTVVGLTAGVSPNMGLAKTIAGLETARGILVDKHLRTSVPGVFAVGDCAQHRKADGSPGGLEQLWYTGRMHGEVVGKLVAHETAELLRERGLPTPGGTLPPAEPYDRGIWFNSAKFVNMEYQTYGFVSNEPDPDTTLWYQHPNEHKGVRLVWEKNRSDTKITGFNLMGLRFRQDVCERWIAEERPVEYVIKNLREANFDPEFFRSKPPLEKAVAQAFQQRSA